MPGRSLGEGRVCSLTTHAKSGAVFGILDQETSNYKLLSGSTLVEAIAAVSEQPLNQQVRASLASSVKVFRLLLSFSSLPRLAVRCMAHISASSGLQGMPSQRPRMRPRALSACGRN